MNRFKPKPISLDELLELIELLVQENKTDSNDKSKDRSLLIMM